MSDVLARLEQANLEGISPSLPHQQGRIWKSGDNIIFHEESIQPAPGQSALLLKPANDIVIGLMEHENTSHVRELFFGNTANLYSWTATGGVVTEGSGYTLSNLATTSQRQQFWSMLPWDSWVLATNGKDMPQIRTTATGFRSFTASDIDFTTAEIFGTLGDFLLAFNTSNGGKWVEWSDTDAPESFNRSATSNAGRIILRELENDIIAAVKLAGGYGIYSSDSMVLLQHTGGDFVFTRRPLISGLGAVGKQAVCAVGGLNFGLSFRGAWQTDGNSFTHIDDPEVHDELFDNVNLEQISKTIVWYDKLLNCVTYWFPETGENNNSKGLFYNLNSKAWSRYNFGRSFAVEASIFPYGITGDAEGNIYAQSVIGAPAGISGAPVVTTPTVTIQAGLGMLGLGQLGLGGYSGDG